MPAPLRATFALACSLLTPLGAAAAETSPLDVSFGATPRQLIDLAAAHASNPGDDVAILLEESRVDLDDEARATRTLRLVYRVLDADGVRFWGSVTADWEPWLSERPKIRARVVSPEGVVSELQESTIDEGPVHDALPDVLTSGRRLRAPLPSLSVGSIVEHETTWTSRRPHLERVASGTWHFGMPVPTGLSRLTLTAPESLPLRVIPRLVAAEAGTRRVEGGRVVITWTRRDVPARKPGLVALPPSMPRTERVSWTTAPSWAFVADGYAAIVDRALEGADIAAEAKAAAGDASDLRTAAARCLAWIHSRVRYTGLEFGEAAIVPATPATCLSRGFGDCKDKATLLVAMMRALGHRADVALMTPRLGGEDIDPEVPSIGVFSHAIAAVGDPPVFVDATAPEAAFGELPASVAGRLALVARRGITDLTRTPPGTPETDRVLETVRVRLAEEGKGELTELTESWGSFAVDARSELVGVTREELATNIGEWCRTAWRADGADQVEASAPDDLSSPTTLRYRALLTARAITEYPHAYVGAMDGGWSSHLPPLLPIPDDEADDEDREREAREAARSEPAELPRAFRWERHYVIEPPPGWEVASLPEPTSWSAGPVSYSSTASSGDDGSVKVLIRFDTGSGSLSAPELRKLRELLAAHDEADVPVVAFRAVADRLLGEGDVRGALAEHRRLAALHPAEALHPVQLSSTLLELGLGDAARDAARAAIRAQPASASGHVALARALLRDSFGRPYRSNADHAQALASAREAVKTDPTNIDALTLLASILSMDEQGRTNWDPASSLVAARAWADVLARAEEPDHDVHAEWLSSLFRAGDMQQLKQAMASWKGERSIGLDALEITAAAMEQGLRPALLLAATPAMRRHDRSDLLELVAGTCAQARRYDLAAEILVEAARGGPRAAVIGARADGMRTIRRIDPQSIGKKTPEDAALRAFALLVSRDVAALESSFANDPLAIASSGTLARAMMKGFVHGVSRSAGPDMPMAVMRDVLCSSVRCTSECDGSGRCRVLIRIPNPERALTVTMVVRQEGESWGITAMEPGPGLAGQFALENAKAGRLDAARHWLDWAHETGIPPLPREPSPPSWRAGQEATPEQIVRAAALVAAHADHGGQAAAELSALRDAATDEGDRAFLERCIVHAHASAQRHAEVARLGRPLLGAEQEPSGFVMAIASSVAALGDTEAEASLAAELSQRWPSHPAIAIYRAESHARRGEYDRALALMRPLEASGRAGAATLMLQNQVAWYGLLAGEPPSALLATAREATAGQASAAAVHTLATILAEAERPLEAHQTLVRSMDASTEDEPGRHDHHVLGRIAESYGELGAARASYERAIDGAPPGDATDVAHLSRRRLALLDAPPATPIADGTAN